MLKKLVVPLTLVILLVSLTLLPILGNSEGRTWSLFQDSSVYAQATRITIEGADAMWEANTQHSDSLASAAKEVPARILAEYADSILRRDLLKSDQLSSQAASVSPRILIEYADSILSIDLEPPILVANESPVQQENSPPMISSLSAEQVQVMPEASIRITATATDADGDSITYKWSCDEGIITGAGHTITWGAPDRNGTYQVSLEVSDGHGGIQKDSISIRVSSETVVTPSSPQQPYVDLYGHQTDVFVGEEVILYLSAVNPITSPGTLIVQLTLRIPSGWSITSSGFGHGAGGLRTNTYEIEQGPSQRVIDVNILANEPFEGIVEGKIDYYFAEYEETKYHSEVTLPVTAGASPESATQSSTASPNGSENEGISGTLIAIIIGVLAATIGGVFARVIWRRVHQPVAERGGVSDELPLPRADERPKQYGETNQKGINQDIYKLITDHLGSKVVDNLSSDVLDQLVQAEKNYQNKEQPRRAITDLYEAVAICLQQYFVGKVLSKLNTLKSYTEQPNLSFSSLAVYQCSDIFSNIDDPNPNKIRDPFIKTRWSLIRDATIQAFPKLNRRRLTILANNLREIQKLRNPYEHLEKDALKDPKPWHEERQDLEYIRSMVLGSEQKVSAIAEIIEIFG